MQRNGMAIGEHTTAKWESKRAKARKRERVRVRARVREDRSRQNCSKANAEENSLTILHAIVFLWVSIEKWNQ